MNVTQRMLTDLKTIDRDATLLEAAHAMLDGNVGFLPVQDGGRLVGVVTDRDLVVRGLAENLNPVDTTVDAVMSLEIVCCFSDESLEAAKHLMKEHNVRRLPVINRDHHLVGVLTRKQLGVAETPKRPRVKVTFQKTKTDSYGRPHKVPIKSVYITGIKEKEAAVASAVKHYEEEQRTAWTNVADELKVEEEGGKSTD